MEETVDESPETGETDLSVFRGCNHEQKSRKSYNSRKQMLDIVLMN